MNDLRINIFYVSEKISKVRWVSEHLKDAERFLTGSWDMDTNHVKIWKLHKNPYDYDEYSPICSDKIDLGVGDVVGIEMVKDHVYAVGSSDGHVSLVKVTLTTENDSLEMLGKSSLLHTFSTVGMPAPCTGISVYGKDIATVGEDGRLNIIDSTNLNTIHRTIDADNINLTSVLYVSPEEVITGNRMGIIRIFDIRACGDGGAGKFVMVDCQDKKRSNYVSCLASHPTLSHIVLAGTEEGSINTWDLRNLSHPASYLCAHDSPITEMAFHKVDPSMLFTTVSSGHMWMWAEQEKGNTGFEVLSRDQNNPWLSGDRIKNRIDVKALITDLRKPLNSFDVHGSRIITGGDTEAVYFFDCCW